MPKLTDPEKPLANIKSPFMRGSGEERSSFIMQCQEVPAMSLWASCSSKDRMPPMARLQAAILQMTAANCAGFKNWVDALRSPIVSVWHSFHHLR